MFLLSWLNRLVKTQNATRSARRSRPGLLTQTSRRDSLSSVSVQAEIAEDRLVLSSITAIPKADATAPAIHVVNTNDQLITVTYCDDIAVMAADIDTGDILVSGPNGYSQVATLVSKTPSTDSAIITAVYSVPAPGLGIWDNLSSGTYGIELLASEVGDGTDFVPGGQIGSFLVETNSLGPDGYGYYASQTDFAFENISGTGTRILTNVDDQFVQLSDAALGDFQFSFYGNAYKTLFVSSNGLITFGSGNSSFVNDDLSSFSQPVIASLWDDLVTTGSGIRWRVNGTGNQQRLIIQWDRVNYIGTSAPLSFQVILYEADNSIQINYQTIDGSGSFSDNGADATVGIRDSGLQPSRRLLISQDAGPNDYVESGKSIRIARDTTGRWTGLGPFSATNGQVENITPNDQIVGALHTVLADPGDSNVLWVGGTNGGIWRTDNAQDSRPNWVPLTDHLPSLSIGALAFDVADTSHQTVYGGIGRFSSFGRFGGPLIGLVRTSDGGASWEVVDGGGVLKGKNISGLYVNGNTIVVSVNRADTFIQANLGIFRSTDGGATFTQMSVGNGAATGLPSGVSYDLVTDPVNPSILYTSIVFTSTGQNGLYKSVNGGASWSKVSTAAVDGFITNGTSNLELAVGNSNQVYAAIINTGSLAALFRSGDGGTTWTQMDTPVTNEGGTNVGLNPRGTKGPPAGSPPEQIAGGQGNIHFSMVADPNNPNIVYVGGDRQPLEYAFPTSVGAQDYSGRLFRGDASRAAGSQFVHLTHSNTLGATGGGTASTSAPHADSRDMTFDADGNLLEVDDGGIYRRTFPQSNTGDWFGIIGDLQVTEAHDVAWDSVSHVAMTGNQDTGTTYQPSPGAGEWISLSTADGGDVAVDDISLAAFGRSIRYSSFQGLGGFRRTTWDSSGNLLFTNFPAVNVISGAALNPGFVTPVVVNTVNPSRLIIQGANAAYESTDRGDTLSQLSSTFSTAENGNLSAIVAGGVLNGVPTADLLWLASGNNVLLRTTAGSPLTRPGLPGTNSTVLDIAVNPNDGTNAFVIDSDQVAMTTTAGTAWSNITGNLMSFADNLNSIQYITTQFFDAVAVGTNAGVFVSVIGAFGTLGEWVRLGENLPNAQVYDMEYDSRDDVLVVGTMGRGAWILGEASETLVRQFVDFDYGDAPSAEVRHSENGPRHVARGIMLGARRDFEVDGFATLNGLGDDSNNLQDDEDGVTFLTSIQSGQQAQISVNVSEAGFLHAYLDRNGNGIVTGEAGEDLLSAVPVVAGDNVFTFSIPAGLTANIASFMRFRVTSTGSFLSDGSAFDGEVEDYAVTILAQPQLFVAVTPKSISENGGSAVGTLSRINADTSVAMTVQLTNSDVSEANVATTVVIPVGASSVNFPITAVDDNLLDGPQTVTLAVSSPGAISGSTTFTVTDFETLSLVINGSHFSENAVASGITATVTRNNADLGSQVIVSLSSSDTNEGTVPPSVVIPAGSASATFVITAVDDLLVDGTKTITITADSGGYVPASDTVDVRDNESAVLVTAQSGGNTVVSEAGLSDTFTVVLSQPPDADVTLALSVSNNLEASLSASTLTFTSANWNVPQTVTVNGVDDVFVDGAKSVTVAISVSDPVSDIFYRDAADVFVPVTVNDNEVAGLIVAQSGGSTELTEVAGTDSVTVRLIDRPIGDVVISVAVSDNTEAIAAPLSLRFTATDWNVPKTVNLSSLDDALADGDITSQLIFSVIPTQSQDLFDSMLPVSVPVITRDNEIAGFQVVESFGKTFVDENGSTDTIGVRLLAAPVTPVVLTVAASNPAEATVSPVTLTFNTQNWNVTQVVTVTGVDDLLFDKAVTSTVTIAIDAANSQDAFDLLPAVNVSVTTNDNEPDPPTFTGPVADTRTHFPLITWTPVAGAASYDLEVFDSHLMVTPIRTANVTTASHRFAAGFDLGRYWLKVRANLSTGISTPFSAHTAFDVRTPPVIQTLARFQPTYRPTISWTPIQNAASYEIQIESRFIARPELILQSGITGTSFTVPRDLPFGLYRVWVRGYATNGKISAWSNPGEFFIAVAPTVTAPPESTFDTTPTFRWNSVLGARAYHVRVTDLTTMQVVIDQTGIRGQEFTPSTPLQTGHHRWNVLAQGENDVVGLWSTAQFLYIGGRTQITSPSGLQPSNRPTIRWQTVEGVFTYEVFVRKTDGAVSVMTVNNLTASQWTPANPLASGNYRVWVRAISSSGQISLWSNPVDIRIAEQTDPLLQENLLAVLPANGLEHPRNAEAQPAMAASRELAVAAAELVTTNSQARRTAAFRANQPVLLTDADSGLNAATGISEIATEGEQPALLDLVISDWSRVIWWK